MHQDRKHTNNTTGRSSTRVAGLQALIVPAFAEVVRTLHGTQPSISSPHSGTKTQICTYRMHNHAPPNDAQGAIEREQLILE